VSLPPKVSLALVAAGLLAAVAPRPAAAQQHNITIDRSFGSPTTLTGPNYSIAITIDADELIASSDSIFSATGQIVFIGPRIDVNGALVVLSTELRSAAQVLREACAAQGNRPQSGLVEAGRGGLPQDPEATLPALYIADRDVNPNPQSLEEATETSGALQTTVRLTMRCG
jgi:hypothetical protein